MNDLRHVYKPSAWGAKFHALPHWEALGAGSAGVGKSWVLLMEPLQQILVEHHRCTLPRSHPHHVKWGESRGWALFLRRTFKMLKQTIENSKRVFPSIDSGAKFSEEDMIWTFSSGFKFQFGHCVKPGDWQIYFSQEYTIIMFDELVQFMKQQYTNIRSRCRTSDPVLAKMLKVRAMSNPVFDNTGDDAFEVDNPFWVREYFVDPAPSGNVTIRKHLRRQDGSIETKDRIYLPGRLHDNPNPEFVAQYELALLEMPEHSRQALLYGNWYFMAGQYFTDVWVPDIHVVPPFAIPAHWPRFRCMDWGFKKPGCVIWYALSPDGNLYAEREYTFVLTKPVDVAKEIKRWEKTQALANDRRSYLTGPADTQIWRSESGEQTIAERMLSEGVRWTQADKRSRKNNARLMYERLKDHRNRTALPGFMIFANQCPNLVRTIPMLPPGSPVDPDEPGEIADDHWLDNAFYAHAYASKPVPVVRPASRKDDGEPPDGDDDEDRERVPGHNPGRYGYGQPLC